MPSLDGYGCEMANTVFERSFPDARIVTESLAAAKLAPFWLDDLGHRAVHPRHTGTARYDLAVIGAGYTGLWTALQAMERDPNARVIVLEAGNVGWAASGRNGGFCEASLTHGEPNGLSRFPKEFDQLQRLGAENLNEIAATVARLGLNCDFERTGSLAVATEQYQIDELESASNGHDEVFYDTAGIRSLVNSPTYLGGLWSKNSTVMLHPGKLAAELARACIAAGVEIREHSAVRSIDSELPVGPVQLTTDDGFVNADRVAIATNAFPSLLKRFRLHTVPVYDYVLMTEPLSDAQLASIGWGGRQGIADQANQFHYYRLSADNRILWGGYDAIYHYGGRIRGSYDDRPQSFERLASHFFTTFPQLVGVKFSHRWSGVIDTSTRFCAYFGRARGGRVAYAAGFTGLGVGASRFAANVMLDHLSGEKTERTELEMVRKMPLPFPPEPATFLAVQATKWALDRADHNHGRRNLLLKTLDAAGLGFDS